MRIYTGKNPYECSMCNYSCNVRSSLTKHKKIHTRENHINVICVIMHVVLNLDLITI
jgi:hypothetical protein